MTGPPDDDLDRLFAALPAEGPSGSDLRLRRRLHVERRRWWLALAAAGHITTLTLAVLLSAQVFAALTANGTLDILALAIAEPDLARGNLRSFSTAVGAGMPYRYSALLAADLAVLILTARMLLHATVLPAPQNGEGSG